MSRRVLVVEDHTPFVAWLKGALDAVEGSLTSIDHPAEAVEHILALGSKPEGERPDVILVDYGFTSDARPERAPTGLAVAAAAHRHLPDSEIVVYSGADPRHGRTLFTAALWHWFGCRKVLSKASSQTELEKFFRGANPTPQWTTQLMNEHAHLIDLFFFSPTNRLFLSTLRATGGDPWRAGKVGVKMSRKSRTRLTGELSQVAAVFGKAMEANPHRPDPVTPEHQGRGHRTAPLVGFAAENASFFTDPFLDDVLAQVQPWERMSRAQAARTCELWGLPFPQS